MKIMDALDVFIINLEKRIDRRDHAFQEFNSKNLFRPRIMKAHENNIGSIGLWESFRHIITISLNMDFVIICEDDHKFTLNYSDEVISNCIKEGENLKADCLMGGVSWFNTAFPISSNLVWVERFTGTQFLIIYKRFYSKILKVNFDIIDHLDSVISELTEKKFLIYPFISTQKSFGYSDITSRNNLKGRVESLFSYTIKRLQFIYKIYNSFKKRGFQNTFNASDIVDITIPTYIVNLTERIERRKHIEEQFKNRNEFDITIVDAIKHEIGALGLWLSFRKIIQLAIDNDDDVIIICEDDHEFTADYSRDFFISNIIAASQLSCDYMHGGTSNFGMAIPITKNIFWTNHCLSTQFIVIYRNFFQKMLDEPFDETIVADLKLSEMATNKLLLCPHISTQKDFGYSDVTPIHNDQKDLVTNMFNSARTRLENIQKAYIEFGEAHF